MQNFFTHDGDFSTHYHGFLSVNPFFPLLLGTWSSPQRVEKNKKKKKKDKENKK
jgi:hypothetical protein